MFRPNGGCIAPRYEYECEWCVCVWSAKKIDACMDGVCKLWLVIGDHLALLHFLCLLLYV